ncbi:MAG: hypothetical protein ABSB94_10255 [Syntrophorhabdales bacterium]
MDKGIELEVGPENKALDSPPSGLYETITGEDGRHYIVPAEGCVCERCGLCPRRRRRVE